MDSGKLLRGVDFLRHKTGANLTLLQTAMLLHILRNPGVTQPELGKEYGTTQATVSRCVNKLAQAVVKTDSGDYDKVGLDLVLLKEDPDDPRRIVCFPSDAGKALIKDLQLLK